MDFSEMFAAAVKEDAISKLNPAEVKQLIALFPPSMRGRRGERTLAQVEDLISLYLEKGGYLVTLQEGSLGYGLTLLVDSDDVGLKTFVIKEYSAGQWSCTHTVRGYNKMPAKYAKMLELAEAEPEDKNGGVYLPF